MNKPVAWMGIRRNGETRVSVEKLNKDDIPLYTHPVKELTDEEIEAVMYKCDWSYDPVNFAKAILRKAQEK